MEIRQRVLSLGMLGLVAGLLTGCPPAAEQSGTGGNTPAVANTPPAANTGGTATATSGVQTTVLNVEGMH